MGLFLAMSGVVGGDQASVQEALLAYAAEHGGSLVEAELTTNDEGCLVICQGVAGSTVFYPSDFFDWDLASERLSLQLRKPVFSFHIHDGDLWMYVLYEDGVVVDQFNPLPDYWNKIDEDERQVWRGNANEVAKRVPGLLPEQIANYLIPWHDDEWESTLQKKAYPDDKYHFGDDWQLVDFIKKLWFSYPLDDSGAPDGVTYRFQCESAERD